MEVMVPIVRAAVVGGRGKCSCVKYDNYADDDDDDDDRRYHGER